MRPLTSAQARRHWHKTLAGWTELAQALEGLVLGIEDKQLQFAVACLLDISAEGYATGIFQEAEGGFAFTGMLYDQETWEGVVQGMSIRFGDDIDAEQIMKDANEWVHNWMKGKPAPFAGWLFGKVKIRTNNDQKVTAFSFNQIQYSMQEQRVIGVLTLLDANDSRCRIVKV